MAAPLAPAKPSGPAGPFGWTGIKTERYTAWKGKLKSREGIILGMIKNSVKHEVKSPWVILMIVLAWVFSVLFTVLSAGAGELSLEMDPDVAASWGDFGIGGDQTQQGVDISLHKLIRNDTTAEFDLTGLNPTHNTTYDISGIPSGWSAYVNQSGIMGQSTLVVTPPDYAMPGATAMISVVAKTRMDDGETRKDKYTTVTTIVEDPSLWCDFEDWRCFKVITPGSVAVFPLGMTSNTTIGEVSPGWTATINTTVFYGIPMESLIVIPPPSAAPGEGVVITVQGDTLVMKEPPGGGEPEMVTEPFEMNTETYIVADSAEAYIKVGLTVEFEKPEFEGKAGDTVRMSFNVTNTGTLADDYKISVLNKPGGWKIKAFAEGRQVEVLTDKYEYPGGPAGVYVIKHKYINVRVEPGETIDCAFEFKSKKESPSSNVISLSANSGIDMAVFGTYGVNIKLTDIANIDLTDMIVYQSTMSLQVLWALLLAAVVGSKTIATDINEKSYNLYFSRPITKTDYVIGKFGTTCTLLSFVTLLPTLVAYTLLILLSDISDSYVWDHLYVWGAIFAWSFVVIFTYASLSIALSSLTNRRFYAAAALVVIFLATTIMAQIVTYGFNVDYGPLLSLQQDFDIIGRTLFRMDIDYIDFPWWYSLGVLVPMWVVSCLGVWTKIEKTELSE